MEGIDNPENKAIWLPYWHLHYRCKEDTPLKKFGQWAPHMDIDVFVGLIKKAKVGGHICL